MSIFSLHNTLLRIKVSLLYVSHRYLRQWYDMKYHYKVCILCNEEKAC
jgi:hypothetical protein